MFVNFDCTINFRVKCTMINQLVIYCKVQHMAAHKFYGLQCVESYGWNCRSYCNFHIHQLKSDVACWEFELKFLLLFP